MCDQLFPLPSVISLRFHQPYHSHTSWSSKMGSCRLSQQNTGMSIAFWCRLYAFINDWPSETGFLWKIRHCLQHFERPTIVGPYQHTTGGDICLDETTTIKPTFLAPWAFHPWWNKNTSRQPKLWFGHSHIKSTFPSHRYSQCHSSVLCSCLVNPLERIESNFDVPNQCSLLQSMVLSNRCWSRCVCMFNAVPRTLISILHSATQPSVDYKQLCRGSLHRNNLELANCLQNVNQCLEAILPIAPLDSKGAIPSWSLKPTTSRS